MSMLKDIYDSRGNGRAVQVISECYILPEGTEAVCYKEMSGNYSVYVLEKQQFHSNYFKRDERWEENPERLEPNMGNIVQRRPRANERREDRRNDGQEVHLS